MRLDEFGPPIGAMGKITKGFPSTGSPEIDDTLDGSDIEKEQKKYVDDKKAQLDKT